MLKNVVVCDTPITAIGYVPLILVSCDGHADVMGS